MNRTHLATFETSAQGLGCMGMSEFYGPTDWDASVATIHRAIELGVTMIDTADVYGAGHNEVLVGRAIDGRRDRVEIATKFGIVRTGGDDARTIRGDAAYVKRSCDTSLLRLGIDVIDLYYIHRPPENVEVEETIGAMADLVTAGKVRFLGVSEFDGELLRRAHAVHPITAMQSEYSIWTRDAEHAAPVMSELGIGLVAYSPLGRGFLTGALDRARLDASDSRNNNPRMSGEAGDANQKIADTVVSIAGEIGAEPAQVALAWVYAQAERLGVKIVTIPGTKRVKWLEQNAGAMDVTLDDDALARLDAVGDQVVGPRYAPAR
jgi:aryl-alcohol dehydrogenase-like predicted oxidoreductase